MSERFTVAIIAGQLVVGGAERQLFLWLSNLDREKFKPVVLTLHPGHEDYWEGPIESLDIPLLRIPRRRNRIARLLDIVSALRPFRPNLIHGWHLFASPYSGFAAKLLGAKSLGFLQSSYQAFRNSPQEALMSLYLLDALMANSYAVGRQLRAVRKRKKQNIYVVQNAVEDQINDRLLMRQMLSTKFGLSSTSLWIGSLARLDPGKRFDLLFQAIALLWRETKNFHFLLIGDGPDREHLANMAEALGIAECVIFAGEVPDARNWLSALDIFCFTSLDEGLPNVVLEAAVAGVPIVSWRVPFIEEILGAAGLPAALMVEPVDLNCYKDTLLKLLASSELRMATGMAGRKHVIQNFSVDRCVQEMTGIYEDLLGIQHTVNREIP